LFPLSFGEKIMYAIIETGGKQYRVEKGDVIDVELVEDKDGKVEFTNVLFLNNGSKAQVGTPHVAKSRVLGELVQEVRGPKVVSFRYKQRKGIARKVGHRQRYTRVKITDIVG
jgi:large subunit ribosomal protein L21